MNTGEEGEGEEKEGEWWEGWDGGGNPDVIQSVIYMYLHVCVNVNMLQYLCRISAEIELLF